MNVTIESFFCPYCDEVTEAYFLLVNTILFADGEDSLRQGLERLKTQVPLDDYFVYGFGAHHLWVRHEYFTLSLSPRRKKRFCQYDYRHTDGELFSCVAPTLEECRAKRDTWLNNRNNK